MLNYGRIALRNRGLFGGRVARLFGDGKQPNSGSDKDGGLLSPIIVEVPFVRVVPKLQKIWKGVLYTSGISMAAAGYFLLHPLSCIPILGLWYWRIITPYQNYSPNHLKDYVHKVTITPEKDKLILEYGISPIKQAEVEISRLQFQEM